MAVKLITFNESLVTPLHDAVIHDLSLSGNGVFFGCNVNILNSNTLRVTNGLGNIYGREFEIEQEDISVTLSTSGTLRGRVYLHMDLANISEPIQLLTQTGTTLPALIDNPNVNELNSSTDLELCTFDVGTTEVSNLVMTVATLQRNTTKNATGSEAGLMSAEDKAKLDGIQAQANKYTLPKATSSVLGGVKTGSNINNNEGTISVSQASKSVKGVVQIGDNLNVNAGTVSLAKANVEGALGYTPVNKAGDILTGDLEIKKDSPQFKITATDVDLLQPNNNVSNDTVKALTVYDKNNYYIGYAGSVVRLDGRVSSVLQARNRKADGTQILGGFGITIDKAGNITYSVTSPSAFREAIGLATIGSDLWGNSDCEFEIKEQKNYGSVRQLNLRFTTKRALQAGVNFEVARLNSKPAEELKKFVWVSDILGFFVTLKTDGKVLIAPSVYVGVGTYCEILETFIF